MRRLAICAFLLLQACGAPAPETQYRRGSGPWLAQQSPDERAVYYNELCQGRGHVPGTMEFANCVVELDQNFRIGHIRNDYYSSFMN